MYQFKQALIDFYIKLGAIGYNFEKPTQWASGTFNPFYVNNRLLQSVPEARKAIGAGLASMIDNPDLIDYVYAVPSAGIAPATLLALELNKPLIIKHDESYYSFNIDAVKEYVKSSLTPMMNDNDIVIGTVPFGIIFGLIAAELMGKPFLFIRDKPKGHGTKDQLEGIVKPGDYATLVDPMMNGVENYTLDAMRVIRDKGIEIPSVFDHPIDNFLHQKQLSDTNIIAVDDLSSTGESCLKEITNLISIGAGVFPCSIFSYDLPSAVANFAKHGLVNQSLVNFKELMGEYRGEINLKDEMEIMKWYEDQPNWGDKNGFPRVIK